MGGGIFINLVLAGAIIYKWATATDVDKEFDYLMRGTLQGISLGISALIPGFFSYYHDNRVLNLAKIRNITLQYLNDDTSLNLADKAEIKAFIESDEFTQRIEKELEAMMNEINDVIPLDSVSVRPSEQTLPINSHPGSGKAESMEPAEPADSEREPLLSSPMK